MPKRKIEDEDEWVQRREEIMELYKTEDKSLAEVIRIEASRGFKRTKPQYERKFKEWKVSKNVRDEEWKFVFTRLTERQNLSKASAVYIRGSLISESRLKKQKSKLRHTVFEQCLEQTGRSSRAKTPPDTRVITPPSSTVHEVEHANKTTRSVCSYDTTSTSRQMQGSPADLASLPSGQQDTNMENTMSTTRMSVRSSRNQPITKDHDDLSQDPIPLSNTSALKDAGHAYTKNQSYLLKWFSAIFLVPSVPPNPTSAAITKSPLATDQMTSTSSWMDPLFQDIVLKHVNTEKAVMLMVQKVKLEADVYAFRSLLQLRGLASIALHTFAGRLLLPAIVDGNISLVRVLLEAGVDPDTRMLQQAESIGRGRESFQLQLTNDPSYNAITSTQMTALHVAVYNRREDMITLLLQHGAHDWRADFPGAFHPVTGSILDVVMELGTRKEWMVDDPDSNRSISHNILKTILHFGAAVAEKSQEMLLWALRHAILRDRLDLIQLMLEYHPKLLDSVMNTPWVILEPASTLKDLGLFQFFVEKGFVPNAMDSEGLGSAVATMASNQNAYTLMTDLRDANLDMDGMAFGLDVNEIRLQRMTIAEESLYGIRGMAALHIAVRDEKESLVRLLLYLGANVNYCCRVYPIQLAAWGGHERIARMLVEAGANVKAVYEGEGCYAFPRNRLRNFRPSARSTAAEIAHGGGYARLAETLKTYGANNSSKSVSASSDGLALLGDAIVEANLELFYRLLADEDLLGRRLQPQHGIRALILAVRHHQGEMLRTLLRGGADPYGKIDPSFKGLEHFDESHVLDPWESPFERAVKISCLDTIKLFLLPKNDTLGEEERLASKRQMSAAFAFAICTGNRKLKYLLRENGLKPCEIDLIMGPHYVQQRLHFALQQAAESKDFVEVERLLDAGAPPNSPNAHAANTSGMMTPLEYAVKYMNIITTGRLIRAGAIINTPAHVLEGRTALQLAASNGNLEIVNLLVSSGASVNACAAAYNGRTALEVACENGHETVVVYLCNRGATPEDRNDVHYRRSLYWAWTNGHYAIADELYKRMTQRHGHDGTQSVEDVVNSVRKEELTFVDREARTQYNIYIADEVSASDEEDNEEQDEQDEQDEERETGLQVTGLSRCEATRLGMNPPKASDITGVHDDLWSHFVPGPSDRQHASTAPSEKKATFSSLSATTNIYEAFLSQQPDNSNGYLWDSVDLE